MLLRPFSKSTMFYHVRRWKIEGHLNFAPGELTILGNCPKQAATYFNFNLQLL